MVSSRGRPVECVLEEKTAAAQPLFVDRVTDANGGYGFDRNADALERRFRLGERGVGDERVLGAVNKEGRRPGVQLAREQLGGEEPPREAYDASDWLVASITD